ncbi:MAG TPA: glycosyltransferase family 9 protein [Caulobacteraceae bacterium]|jgi:ADP-heptose:LPS heptosyltransferase|nr:glycosyltransferase family 9 protein [Caulobacteraceae bacterium]
MAAKSFPVLFVAPEGVSEAVLASGLLKKLHDEAPNPRFTIIANRSVAPLYADMPKVERIVVTERKASGRRWFGVLGPVRAQRWALVVDMPSGVITGRLRPKGKALRRSHDEPAHKLFEAARLMRLEEDPPAPYLFVSDETEAKAARLTGGDAPILAIAPTAEWVGKAWPIERFAEVTRRLLGPGGAFSGGRLMVLGERGEAHEVEPVKSTAPRDLVIDFVGKGDLLTAFAALRRARLFIGNDNGFTQLAAAAGAPTLALFGPSDDRIWRPWGERVRVVRGARTLDELRRVDSTLSAQVRHMIDLSADSVLSAAESLLDETASVA